MKIFTLIIIIRVILYSTALVSKQGPVGQIRPGHGKHLAAMSLEPIQAYNCWYLGLIYTDIPVFYVDPLSRLFHKNDRSHARTHTNNLQDHRDVWEKAWVYIYTIRFHYENNKISFHENNVNIFVLALLEKQKGIQQRHLHDPSTSIHRFGRGKLHILFIKSNHCAFIHENVYIRMISLQAFWMICLYGKYLVDLKRSERWYQWPIQAFLLGFTMKL